MDRRKFLSDACKICAGGIALGGVVSAFSSCVTSTRIKATIYNQTIAIPATSWVSSKGVVVQCNELPFYLLCVKVDDKNYSTLEMKCTHQDQPLNYTQDKLYCASHGSQFDLQGNAIAPPAQKTLKKFKTEIVNDQILIHLNKS